MVNNTAIVVHDTCIQSIIQSNTNKVKLKIKKLEIWGRAQRKAARGYASMPWSISSVCKNLRGQHPLRAEI